MRKNFVPQKDINLVVDGLNKYFQRMVETHTFNPFEMKNFMEPIFSEAGYRQFNYENNLMGGGEKCNLLISHIAGGVGDFVQMSPAVREIRRLYSDAHITMIVYERAANLAELCPHIDELIVDVRRCDWKNFLSIYQWNIEIAKKLLLSRYDMVFPLVGYPSGILLAYMSGAKKIFSFKPTSNKHFVESFGPMVYEPFLFEIPSPTITIKETNDFSKNLLLLDSIAQYPIDNREGEVWFGSADRSFARDILKDHLANDQKIYVICMGGTFLCKQWSPQNYARLAQKIIEHEPNTQFVLTGGGQIDQQSAMIFKQSVSEKFFAEHVIDLTNKTTYRQTAAILELADMYIGNDTGTLHIAAVVKTPVLLQLCFPADGNMLDWTVPKRCYPWHVPSVLVMPKHALPECVNDKSTHGCSIWNRPHCITQITVEKVFEGYNILKERIAANNIEPLFIS